MNELEQWRLYADQQLSPIERVKDQLRAIVASLHHDHPSWEQTNDGRWAWVTGAKKILQSTQLQLLFIKTGVGHNMWWQKLVMQYADNEIGEHIKELEKGIRFLLFQSSFAAIEESLRDIMRAIHPHNTKKSTAFIATICMELFKPAPDVITLFGISRLMRNTIHSNGVFYPGDQRDVCKQVNNRCFHFIVGQRITLFDYDTILWILS